MVLIEYRLSLKGLYCFNYILKHYTVTSLGYTSVQESIKSTPGLVDKAAVELVSQLNVLKESQLTNGKIIVHASSAMHKVLHPPPLPTTPPPHELELMAIIFVVSDS